MVKGFQERAQDRALLRTLSFSVNESTSGPTYQPDGPIVLELVNKARGTVRVLDVRIDGPGFPTVPVDDVAGHFGSVTVVLDRAVACDTALYTRRVTGLVVRAATPRGAVATLTVPLEAGLAEGAWMRARQECGYLMPDEGFWAQLEGASLRHGVLTLTYGLQNATSLPVVVDSITAAEGLEVRAPALPLTVAAANSSANEPGLGRLRIQVRVGRCDRLAAVLQRQPYSASPTAPGAR